MNKRHEMNCFSTISASILFLGMAWPSIGIAVSADSLPGVRKVKDVVIYKDDRFHAAFLSVVQLPDGELLLAFRRPPERKRMGEQERFWRSNKARGAFGMSS